MSFSPPHAVTAHADERELLPGFLRLQRELVVATTSDLTEEQARWRPDGKLIAIEQTPHHAGHAESTREMLDGRPCDF